MTLQNEAAAYEQGVPYLESEVPQGWNWSAYRKLERLSVHVPPPSLSFNVIYPA